MDWDNLFSEVFPGKRPYGDYQIRTARFLLEERRNVLLQTPTGSGKTITAEFPFLAAPRLHIPFPAKMIYSVPMRVLANQFFDDFQGKVAGTHPLTVGLLTGDRPEDRMMQSQAVFTTIDQTLSSFFGIPYSLSRRMANMNAGAVAGSYLVFDEFHLFPPKQAFRATLQMLQLLKGVTPFLLMTATFSKTMLRELAQLLDAEVVTVSSDELKNIPSQRGKQRSFEYVDECLTADHIVVEHTRLSGPFRRSIAVCNQVERAQLLFNELVKRVDPSTVILLHARFLPEHRANKESRIQREFGPQKNQWSEPDLIVIATQVIEVGLDITCDVLHTEVAPANAILQRAGRCARYEGETGRVLIYQVPPDRTGLRRNYMPYSDDGQDLLCQKTSVAFAQPNRQRLVLTFIDEQAIINEVHDAMDANLIADVRQSVPSTMQHIEHALGEGDTSARRELIRSIDSRTLLVHDDPKTIVDPFACKGFSLFRGSLLSAFEELQKWQIEKELPWALKYPVEEESKRDSDDWKPPQYSWLPVSTKEILTASPLMVIHPELVAYDESLGFRFHPGGTSFRTAPPERSEQPERKTYSYRLETYEQHICRMWDIYRRLFAGELAYLATCLERRNGWPESAVRRAVGLAIALHDTGKMEKRWQQWVRAYQAAIGEPINDPNQMIVHTHWEPDNPLHQLAEKEIKIQRPNHAGEGAIAVAWVIQTAVGGVEALRRAVMTAIARHHSAFLDTAQPYTLHPAAQQAVNAALKCIWESSWKPQVQRWNPVLKEERKLSGDLLIPGQRPWDWWLVYMLIVRALRLADGLSQEENA